MNQKKIFIVDDDPDIRKLLKKVLQDEAWYSCEDFPHHRDAKRRLAKVKPDLFILDIMFDDGDVTDFLAFRAENLEIQKIPVIIISASKNRKIINKVQAFDISDYHLKPVKPNVIKSSVKRVLKEGDPADFMFEDIEPINIQLPLIFTEVSEVSFFGECEVKLEADQEYSVESDFLEQYGISSDKLLAIQNSFLSSETKQFVTKFQIRGANESFLSKVRSGKL